jgi:hypothetical protein
MKTRGVVFSKVAPVLRQRIQDDVLALLSVSGTIDPVEIYRQLQQKILA